MEIGFDATVSINGNELKNIGDINCDVADTELEVANRASREKRYLPGMSSRTFDLKVQAGTDVDDEGNTTWDGYSFLVGAYQGRTTFPVSFTSPGGFTWNKNMIVTKVAPEEPVDGLSTATFTLKVSAKAAAAGGSTGGSGE